MAYIDKMAVDNDGNVVLSNKEWIRFFNPEGELLKEVSPACCDMGYQLGCIAISSTGKLIVQLNTDLELKRS